MAHGVETNSFGEDLRFDESGSFEDQFFEAEDFSDFFADGFDTENFLNSNQQEGADPFIGAAFRRARQLVRTALPVLRTMAPIAMRAVGGPALGPIAKLLRESPGDLPEGEYVGDGFDPVGGLGESETEALAEALLAEAGRVASDAEASALSGGITITITGPAPMAVRRIAPVIARGTASLVQTLRGSPQTRPLVPVAGAIARATARDLAQRAATGRPVTAAVAKQVMARKTGQTLAQPAAVTRAVARSTIIRRRLNRSAVAGAER